MGMQVGKSGSIGTSAWLRSFCTLIFVLCAGAGCSRAEPEPLAKSYERIQQAIDRKDAKTLMSYMTEKEISELALTESKLSSFLSGPYATRMEGFELEGSQKVMEDSPGWYAAQQMYRAADGRRVGRVIQVKLTDNGPKVYPMLSPLVLQTFATYQPASKEISPQVLKQGWSKGARTLGPRLDEIGLTKMTVDETVPKNYTWAEWAAKNGT